MRNKFWIVTGLIAMCCVFTNTAEAQFWKKKSKRKKEKLVYPLPPEKRLTRPADGKDQQAKKENNSSKEKSLYPQTEFKQRYRVDILAPFYLDELVEDGKTTFKQKMPAKAMQSVLFYEGVSLAIDTLKKMGYKLDVYVHDVRDSIQSLQTLINIGTFETSDLLIGVLSSNDFKYMSDYAKRKQINFVSALSPSDAGVSDNQFFTMLQPTLETHCEAIKTRMYNKYAGRPVTLLYRTNVGVDNSAYELFMQSSEDVLYKPLSCNEMPTYEQLKPFFSGSVSNVILMPIINDKYASILLEKLHEWFPEYEFDVWGMPSWNDMQSLRKSDAFPNIAVFFTRPFYFDVTTAKGQQLLKQYKRKYGGTPDNMVFRGYETLYWYTYLLNKYGTIFNTNMRDNGGAPFTRFDMITNTDEDGDLLYHENKNVYLYRYQSSSYMVQH